MCLCSFGEVTVMVRSHGEVTCKVIEVVIVLTVGGEGKKKMARYVSMRQVK